MTAESWVRAMANRLGLDPDEAAHAHLLAVEKNRAARSVDTEEQTDEH